jgi:hypothetical protein
MLLIKLLLLLKINLLLPIICAKEVKVMDMQFQMLTVQILTFILSQETQLDLVILGGYLVEEMVIVLLQKEFTLMVHKLGI